MGWYLRRSNQPRYHCSGIPGVHKYRGLARPRNRALRLLDSALTRVAYVPHEHNVGRVNRNEQRMVALRFARAGGSVRGNSRNLGERDGFQSPVRGWFADFKRRRRREALEVVALGIATK